MAKTELQLLDELDEARHELRAYRRGLWLAVAAALMFLVMILVGAVVGMWSTAVRVDFGGQATLLIVLGSIGTLASTGVGAWWFERNNSRVKDGYTSLREPCPSPAARVRAAERAHRNHILEQS